MKPSVWIMTLGLLPSVADADETFSMTVMDVFSITGSGIVATGRIERGSISKGDLVCLVSSTGGGHREVTIEGIEQFQKILESAGEGENVGLLLSDVTKGEVDKGDEIRGDC